MKNTSTTITLIIRIVIFVLILALLAGVLGFAISYIGNGQRNFYVAYGSETIVSEKKGVELPKNEYSIFYCGTLTGQVTDYSVEIRLNVKGIENFDFKVDDSRKNFRNDLIDYDCSRLFKLTKSPKYFTLMVPGEITIEDVIRLKYPDKTITGVSKKVLETNDVFILTVTESVESSVTQIQFSVTPKSTENISETPAEPSPGNSPEPSPEDIKTYRISYDSLGSGSLLVLDINCITEAAAGERVTIMANVKPEYIEEYRISRLCVTFSEWDDYEYKYWYDVSGLYTFTMPSASEMEIAKSVVLLFYIEQIIEEAE